MPRIARVVVSGVPHHLTQRGNRRENVFLCDDDRQQYLQLLLEYSMKHELLTLAYCLMTNHVHLVSIPPHADSLALVFMPLDLRYAQHINWSVGTSGRLWQGRNTRTGRPAGGEKFVADLESRLGRSLRARPIGRPRKDRSRIA